MPTKSSPEMVTSAPSEPLAAMFCWAIPDSTGASKLKTAGSDVPTDAVTVTCTRSRMVARSRLAAAAQSTLESDDQDVVLHMSSVILAVVVVSAVAKFRPSREIEAPPVVG